MTFEIMLNYFHNFDILEKFLKDWALNKKYIGEKDDFEVDDLRGHTLFDEKFASLNC